MATANMGELRWHKSSYSGNSGNCVEVAPVDASAAVRDSKDRDGGMLVLSAGTWGHFRAALKDASESPV